MNGKTSKLLKKYARMTGKKYELVKRWWEGLSPGEKGKARKTMERYFEALNETVKRRSGELPLVRNARIPS